MVEGNEIIGAQDETQVSEVQELLRADLEGDLQK
jgi:hypothetical protein